MSFNVSEKVALVTGANRGIGKAIVHSLLQQGAHKVYLAVRNVESAQELVNQYSDKVIPIPVDLSQPETIKVAAEQASDVHLVVNNAGILQHATPLSVNAIELFQKEIDVNVFGLIYMSQAFAPILKNNGGGAFVQLNSVASMKSFSAFATYSASKAAAYSLTQALRELLALQGTHVVSVHPGPINTDMAQEAGLGEVAESPTLVSEAIIAALKAGEFHVFPDSMAQMCAGHYEQFAQNIVEMNLMEA